MDWVESLNETVRYIEENLKSGVDGCAAAKHVAISRLYLDKAFSILTGMTISEYIRARKLSLAGQELLSGNAKVIDVALRYGYDTPESFAKAFSRFHGIAPSNAKKTGAVLRCQNPLAIKIVMEGATVMNYRIETMGAFTVFGVERTFEEGTSFQEIPKYWGEFFQKGYQKQVCPVYGICLDMCGGNGTFQYLIGDNCEADAAVPDGFVKREIPSHTWAIFSCTGALPDALQQVNRQIYTEWLPGNPDYEAADGINIEMYSEGDTSSADYHSEIWLPVRKKK